MPRSLRVALLALLIVGFGVPLLRADSIPIGQMGVMGPGGCDWMHCCKDMGFCVDRRRSRRFSTGCTFR